MEVGVDHPREARRRLKVSRSPEPLAVSSREGPRRLLPPKENTYPPSLHLPHIALIRALARVVTGTERLTGRGLRRPLREGIGPFRTGWRPNARPPARRPAVTG